MFQRITNLKLSTKAMLATLISFMVNIFWLVAMWGNSLQIQDLSKREKQQANFVQSISELTQIYYQLQGGFFSAFMSKNSHQLELFNQDYAQFFSALGLVNNNPNLLQNQRASLADFGKLATSQKDILQDCYSAPDDDTLFRFMRYKKPLSAILKANFDETHDVKALMAPQRQELDKLRSEQEVGQRIFLTLLLSGVSANLIVAIFLHFAYGHYISARTNALVASAKALSLKEVMLAPLSSQDEFAIVDAALHEASNQIVQAFEQKQALMQMIAHDLKSPLAASQVVLETMLMRDKDALTEAGLETISSVTGNHISLLSLITDLLTIDALELGHLELTILPEEIGRCVKAAVEILAASAAARDVTFKINVGDDVGLFDYQRIQQVMVNLISNAIKFSEAGSEIRINCEKTRNSKLKISVVDRGIGIAKKNQSKVFQKYFQTDESKRAAGTGLGLAISKLIIESHGEQIGFESQQFQGTTFWFSLTDGEAD